MNSNKTVVLIILCITLLLDVSSALLPRVPGLYLGSFVKYVDRLFVWSVNGSNQYPVAGG